MSHYLSLVLLTPLAGAALLAFVPGRHERVIRWCATLIAAAGCGLALPLWFAFDTKRTSYQFVERVPWLPSIGAQYFVGVDGLSTVLILMTTLIVCLVMLSSWTAVTERVKEYYLCLLVLQSGLVGAFMALDFLLFVAFWDVVLVPLTVLIGLWGGANRRRSAVRFVAGSLVGSLMLLIGIGVLYVTYHAATGVYSFDVTAYQQFGFDPAVQWWAFLALALGFAIKAAIFPFHSWLADAYADAPSAGSVLLAAVFLKIGTYAFLRFSLPILPDASHRFVPVIAALCLVGVGYGGLVALTQRDWTRLIACISVSQMAMVMLGIMSLNPVGITGGVVQHVNHSLSSGALLMLVGVVDQRRRAHASVSPGEGRGLSAAMPIYAAIFLAMTMVSAGLPALSGFVAGFLLVQGVFIASPLWTIVVAGGLVIGAASMWSLYERTMGARMTSPDGGVLGPDDDGLADLGVREILTFAPLLALTVWIGIYPKPLLDRLATSVDRVVARVSPEYGQNAMAECGAPPTAETAKTNPAAAFLTAVPCGLDGKPLPAPETAAPR